jgi:dipeptidase D
MKVFATHGGLECGILSDKLEGLDCVSVGPELSDIHSPAERLGVASVGELYRLLLAILKKC